MAIELRLVVVWSFTGPTSIRPKPLPEPVGVMISWTDWYQYRGRV